MIKKHLKFLLIITKHFGLSVGGQWLVHRMEFSMHHLLFPKMAYPLNSLSSDAPIELVNAQFLFDC